MKISYQVSDNASIESLLDIVIAKTAQLVAAKAPEDVIQQWRTFREELLQRRVERDEARANRITTSAIVDMTDAQFDEQVSLLSGSAFLASGRNAKQAPYVNLFDPVSARDAQKLGAHRATVFADRLIAKLVEMNHPQLNPFIDVLKTVSGDLKKSAAARDEADQVLTTHELRRQRLVTALEALISGTGLRLATHFPGQKRLVETLINPYPSNRARRKTVAVQVEAASSEDPGLSQGDQDPQGD